MTDLTPLPGSRQTAVAEYVWNNRENCFSRDAVSGLTGTVYGRMEVLMDMLTDTSLVLKTLERMSRCRVRRL